MSQIDFSAENPAAARHQALADAIQTARGDAQAMARAAGGSLGELLQLTTEQPGMMPGVTFEPLTVTAARRAPEPVETTVVPSEIRVTAHVVARWKFIPAGR